MNTSTRSSQTPETHPPAAALRAFLDRAEGVASESAADIEAQIRLATSELPPADDDTERFHARLVAIVSAADRRPRLPDLRRSD